MFFNFHRTENRIEHAQKKSSSLRAQRSNLRNDRADRHAAAWLAITNPVVVFATAAMRAARDSGFIANSPHNIWCYCLRIIQQLFRLVREPIKINGYMRLTIELNWGFV